MIRRYGIDTSVLVRLITKDPEDEFDRCVGELRALVEEHDSEMFASNQVVGEAYVAVRHHYGVSAADARSTLTDALTSGLVAPLTPNPPMDGVRTAEGG